MITCPCCKHEFTAPVSMPSGLTPTQRELMTFINLYLAEQDGISPSFEEMKNYLGLASKSGVHRLIAGLEERGLIRRLQNRARSIVVVGSAA